MINQLDKVLRRLLIYDLPIKNGEVEIAFEQPKGEWSAKLNRPTLNLFLYDVRENMTLREPEWEIKRTGNGTVTRQRKPIRLDLHYMITVWAANPDDEHSLIARTLKVLFRHPCLPPPEDVLQKTEDKAFWREMIKDWPEVLRDQPAPLPLRVAQADVLRNPAEIWSAMSNELRPAIACAITIALNPYGVDTAPMVLTRELHFKQSEGEAEVKATLEYEVETKPEDKGQRDENAEQNKFDHFWMVGGRIHNQEPLEEVKLVLIERGLEVLVREDGRFIIGNLEAGNYILEVSIKGGQASQHKLVVPSQNYDIQI